MGARIAAAIIACALAAQAACADAGDPPPVKATLADVAWLQGYWDGEGLGGQIEDVILPPRAGVMLGAFRLVKRGGPGFYELFAVEESEGSLRFVVKHFNPDWVGWEEKDKALVRRLTRLAPGEARFGGIGFVREGDDGLRVELETRDKQGVSRSFELRFRKRPL